MSLTPEEQFELGLNYLNSYKQHKDFSIKTGTEDSDIDEYHAKAVNWFTLAADQGFPDAQCALGEVFCEGIGVEKNYELAINWFRKAARKGQDHAIAQFNLGIMYHNGWGVKRSKPQALKWWTEAAENGHEEAPLEVAQMYRDGVGTGVNSREACKWFRILAEKGDAQSQFSLGELLSIVSEIGEVDYFEAVKWYRLAAEQDVVEAQLALGNLLSDKSMGEILDFPEALKWYQRALNHGNEYAAEKIKQCKSEMVRFDKKSEPVERYRKAAENGDAEAQFELGLRYKWGDGVAKDNERAKHWLHLAADQGHAGAQYYLGRMLEDEWDYIEKTTEFFDWYLKASMHGHLQAQTALSALYHRGEAIPEDRFKAFVWQYIASIEDEFRTTDDVLKECIEYDLLKPEEIAAATESALKLHQDIKEKNRDYPFDKDWLEP